MNNWHVRIRWMTPILLLVWTGALTGCHQGAPATLPFSTATPDLMAIHAQETIEASLQQDTGTDEVGASPAVTEQPANTSASAQDVTPADPLPVAEAPATSTHTATSTPTATATPTVTSMPTATPTPDLAATATNQAATLATGVAATLAARATQEAQAAQMAAAVAATLTAQAPTATSTPRPSLTPRPSPTLQPTATPLSETPLRLAYIYGDVRDSDIHVLDMTSGLDRTVANRSCDEAEPSWAPGGKLLFYHSDCAGTYDLYAVDIERGAVQQLTTSPCDEREPDSSPDGRQLVYRRNCMTQAYNVDGELWVLSLADGSENYLGVQGRAPAWSPDGARLAFMSDRSGGWEIYVYEFASGATRQITDCYENCRFPAWSPDSQTIIYHTTTGPTTTDAATLWIVSAQGGEPRLLVTGEGAGRATWSATGWIAFNSRQGVELVDATGGQRRTLLSGDTPWGPVWSR